MQFVASLLFLLFTVHRFLWFVAVYGLRRFLWFVTVHGLRRNRLRRSRVAQQCFKGLALGRRDAATKVR